MATILAAGCGGEVDPTASFLSLVPAGVDHGHLDPGPLGAAPAPGGELALVALPGSDEPWVRWHAPDEAWGPFVPGVWETALPLRATGPADGGALHLIHGLDGTGDAAIEADRFSGQGEFNLVDVASSRAAVAGDFRLLVRSEERPRGLVVETRLGGTGERAGRQRIDLGDVTADGCLLLSGPERAVGLALPPVAPQVPLTLHFATRRLDSGGDDAGAQIEVELDGVVLERRALEGSTDRIHEHAIDLPPLQSNAGALRFALVGRGAAIALLEPRLAPTAPPSPARPDLVVFLADTLRADLLAAYRGHPNDDETGALPAVDRWADGALVFENAWSSAAWTLPSHATLFTGLQPPEHGAVASDLRLPDRMATLALRLREAGYRTAALSEGAFVSARHGLDQGFERFDEGSRDLDETLARARAILAVDDGRPLLLFVQTYRVHTPYRASDRARRQVRTRVAIPDDYAALEARMRPRIAAVGPRGSALPDDVLAMAEEARALYVAGAADLDAAFAAFVADLEARPRGDSTALVFTSDHGESFGAHDAIAHPNGVWDAETRIPLVLRGPGVAAGTRDDAAGLVDLAPTLARLAGVDPDPIWSGRDLLAPPPTAAVAMTWGSSGPVAPFAVAAMDGRAKLVERVDDGRRQQFDLRADPHERSALAPSRGDLARALDDRPTATVAGPPVALTTDDATRRALEAMGYITGE